MIFTISPADAQAIQESELQLLMAIAQATKGMAIALQTRQPVQTTEPLQAENGATPNPHHDFRIQIGRRLVYGQMARGDFRNTIDKATHKAILEAIQRPETPDIDRSQYQKKIPAIEIKQGQEVVFREERDGTISVNHIQFELSQEQSAETAPSVTEPLTKEAQGEGMTEPLAEEKPVDAPSVEPVMLVSDRPTWNLPQLVQTAEVLINPLGTSEPIYDAVSVGGYEIATQEGHLTICKNGNTILSATDGNVQTHQLTQSDWQFFQAVGARSLQHLQHQEQDPPPQLEPVEHQENGLSHRGEENSYGRSLPTRNDHQPLVLNGSARSVVDAESLILTSQSLSNGHANGQLSQANGNLKDRQPQPQSSGHSNGHGAIADPLLDITDELAQQPNIPAALTVAERQLEKLPSNHTQTLLQSTVQAWNEQLKPGLAKGINWLVTKAEAWRQHQTARAVFELYQRGHQRTGERTYTIGEYTISFRGRNLLTLSDSSGELMRLHAQRMPIPGAEHYRLRVTAASDRLTSFQHNELQSFQHAPTLMPQGNLDVEATYMAKVAQVEQTVTHFLHHHVRANVWEREGSHFKFERDDSGLLRITDKQEGRSVVFRRHKGRVFSRLGGKDFAHFARLADRMQAITQQQAPQHVQASPTTNNHEVIGSKRKGLELELS